MTIKHKFKNIEIISDSFPNHNSMKQEINYEVKTGKYRNIWRLKFTDNCWVKELKDKSRNTLRQTKTKVQHSPKHMGFKEKAILRGKFIVINAFIKK